MNTRMWWKAPRMDPHCFCTMVSDHLSGKEYQGKGPRIRAARQQAAPGSATHPAQGLALAQSLTLSDSDGSDSFSSSLEIRKHIQTSDTTCLQLPNRVYRSRIQTQLSVCEASTLSSTPPHLPSPWQNKPMSAPWPPNFTLQPGSKSSSCRGPKEHHCLSVGLGAKPSNHIPFQVRGKSFKS